jgi:endonuclease YncB( thermonuclease family)
MTAHVCTALLLCWAVAATPVRVIDGDTFTADVRIWPGLTARETIRLLGVNTPELQGETRPAGEAARAFTATWLDQGDVRLHACQRDSFGRLLATVTRGSENLTTLLLEGGYGVKR